MNESSAASLHVPRFCLGCIGEQDYEIIRATDSQGREHTYSGTWPIAPDCLRALIEVAHAALDVEYPDARLRAALDAFDSDCATSVASGG